MYYFSYNVLLLLFGNFLEEIIQSLFMKEIFKYYSEIFKVKGGPAPEIMAEIFKFKDQSYYLRIIRLCKYGSETVSNLGTKLWDILPENIKKAESLQEFKNEIKYWTLLNCPCKLCKTYIANVGYV